MHELNGVAKRYNRTVMNCTRCLLEEAKLNKIYWPECVLTSVYLGNRLPANTILKKTPYEIVFGKKPDVSNLHLYGSVAYVTVPETCRTSKLNPKAVKGILIGYTDVGYKILIDNKIIVSRNVRFIEDTPTITISERCKEDEEELQIKIKKSDEEANDKNRNMYDQKEMKENNTTKEKDNIEEVVNLRRSVRKANAPKRYGEPIVYINYTNVMVPSSYEEATDSPEADMWQKAMNEEIKSLEGNETWEITKEPTDKRVIDVKWIYRIKTNGQYKARVVARGFQQLYLEEEELYSPVARMCTLKLMLSITCCLSGSIQSEIYIRPAKGYEVPSGQCKLKKALYGLKESPRKWYECFHTYMLNINFKRSNYDCCLYYKGEVEKQIYIILYVDDLLICCSDLDEIEDVKILLNKRFQMNT